MTGPCEASAGVDPTSRLGIRVLTCRQPGVEHPFSQFGIILCPQHCASLARSEKYVTTWGEDHCAH